MAASFRITSTGGREIEQKLGHLVEAFGDLTPLMEGMGLYLESATIDRFDREEAPDGSRWVKSKRAKDEGGKTLTDRGILRQSVHSVAGSRNVEVGTNLIYAGVHQFGFDGPVTVSAHKRTTRRVFNLVLSDPITFDVPSFQRHMKMPARPFLGLSGEDEAELLAQVDDYARDAMGDAA